jgi:multidrug efflux pump subunit AcrA (membrane-fusion protein)
MAAEANLDKFSVRLAEANARVAISQRQEQQVPTRQWRDSPERAEAAYDQALTNYNRAKQLFDAGVVARQELDARETDLRMARDDLDNAKKLADVSSKLDHEQTDQATLQARVTRQGIAGAIAPGEIEVRESETASRWNGRASDAAWGGVRDLRPPRRSHSRRHAFSSTCGIGSYDRGGSSGGEDNLRAEGWPSGSG